jgi:hypothetical protein
MKRSLEEWLRLFGASYPVCSFILILYCSSHALLHSIQGSKSAAADSVGIRMQNGEWLRARSLMMLLTGAKNAVKDEATGVSFGQFIGACEDPCRHSSRRLSQSHQVLPATTSERASTFDNRRENKRSRAYDNRNYVSGA